MGDPVAGEMAQKLLLLLALVAAYGHVSQAVLPMVIWHGLGDTCCNPFTTGALKKEFKKNIPGVYVLSLKIGYSFLQETYNGWFMNANDQVKQACSILKNDSRLANGYNAIGFSQGGQFLRAVAQRCPEPQMNNLVSVGGQHQGVFGLPRCPGLKEDGLCESIRKNLTRGAYSSFLQNHVVPAEYWQDPFHYDEYVKKSVFLADINNEKTYKPEYKTNLQKLANFVMVRFMRDSVVQPSISEWFGFYAPGTDNHTIPMNETRVYKKDLLGLQAMQAAGKLHFLACDSEHMHFDVAYLKQNLLPWFELK